MKFKCTFGRSGGLWNTHEDEEHSYVGEFEDLEEAENSAHDSAFDSFIGDHINCGFDDENYEYELDKLWSRVYFNAKKV